MKEKIEARLEVLKVELAKGKIAAENLANELTSTQRIIVQIEGAIFVCEEFLAPEAV